MFIYSLFIPIINLLLSLLHYRYYQLLRTSILALSRKVLSYREIDTVLSVACLVMLPYQAMVAELKAAVPSIQVSRRRVGEGVGR